jgi:hypothetical protein
MFDVDSNFQSACPWSRAYPYKEHLGSPLSRAGWTIRSRWSPSTNTTARRRPAISSTWVMGAAAGRRCAPNAIEHGVAPIHFG